MTDDKDDTGNVFQFPGATAEEPRPNFLEREAVRIFLDDLSPFSDVDLMHFREKLINTRELADTFVLLLEAEQDRRGPRHE